MVFPVDVGETEKRPDLSIGVVHYGDLSRMSGTTQRLLQTLGSLRRYGDIVIYLLHTGEPDRRLFVPIPEPIVWLPMSRRRVLPHDYLLCLLGLRARSMMVLKPRDQRKQSSAIIGEHDLYWTYGYRSFLSLPNALRRSGRAVADLVDYEPLLGLELARRSDGAGVARMLLAKGDARALHRAFRSIAHTCHRAVISSEVDRARLGCREVTVLPNTYPRVERPQSGPLLEQAPVFVFIGSLGYWPNIDAVSWLIRDIWPIVLSRRPDAVLRVIGRGVAPPEALDAPGVTVVGEVADCAPELAGATATVVPLRAGSGTRIKILEGWAHGVPVISTTVGAEGLLGRDGQQYLIADTPEDFADAMLRVTSDGALREGLIRNGLDLWAQRYSGAAVDAAVDEVLASLRAE